MKAHIPARAPASGSWWVATTTRITAKHPVATVKAVAQRAKLAVLAEPKISLMYAIMDIPFQNSEQAPTPADPPAFQFNFPDEPVRNG
jgi:hypothetical protein